MGDEIVVTRTCGECVAVTGRCTTCARWFCSHLLKRWAGKWFCVESYPKETT